MILKVLYFGLFWWLIGLAVGGGVFWLKDEALKKAATPSEKADQKIAETEFKESLSANVYSAFGGGGEIKYDGKEEDERLETKTIGADRRQDEVRAKTQVETAAETIALDMPTAIAEQGDTLVLKVSGVATDGDSGVELKVGKKSVPLVAIGGRLTGIYGVDARETPGTVEAELIKNGVVVDKRTLTIRKRDWSVTELVLSEEQKKLGYTPAKAKEDLNNNDNAALYAVFKKPLSDVYFEGQFLYPLAQEAEIVGAFGNIRKSGATEIRHLGVDLEAQRGAPVYAAQKGVVRLARYLDNFGNTVVIDHGGSIFSLYLHLDAIKTEVGRVVEKKEEIGTVGNTGNYSLGPHLHFSIKLNGASVDPLRFLKATESLKI